MSLPSNKKLSILYILEVLKEYSDSEHLLTQEEIINKIYSNYGLELERKSISSNIDSLMDFGYDIIKTKNGCYLNSREFEPSEIQFLVDAIFSSKSINSKHCKELANKLSKTLSKYDRKQYNYIYKADSMNRTKNKQVFYTIDILNEAINEGKKVEFVYRNNKTYVSPYYLVNNQGRYYIVCNVKSSDPKINNDSISNYRVDRIVNIKILDSKIRPINTLKDCAKGFDITDYANKNIYMFSNNMTKAKIKICNDIDYTVDAVIDWFGESSKIYNEGKEIYADIETNKESLIYWCLQYGERVELVEPQDARDKIRSVISEMKDKYMDTQGVIELERDRFIEDQELMVPEDKMIEISIKKAAEDAFAQSGRYYGKTLTEEEKNFIYEKTEEVVKECVANEFKDMNGCFKKLVDAFNGALKENTGDGVLKVLFEKIKQGEEKKEEERKGLGKAFKFASMVFKYLYCFDSIRNRFESQFEQCCIPLDTYTLNWYERESNRYKTRLNKANGWSNIGPKLYKDIQEDIQDIINKGYCYKYNYKGKIIRCYPKTRLALEFIIWRKEKRKVNGKEKKE